MTLFGKEKPEPRVVHVGACPRCRCADGDFKSALKQPTADDTGKRIGSIFGCPRCGLLYAVTESECYELGDRVAQFSKPRMPNLTTPATAPVANGGAPSGEEDGRPRANTDADMNWTRGRR